jgi:hypothetical protein
MRSAIVENAQARRRTVLERLNAYDSGPHEDDRRAEKQSRLCMEVLHEANRWPCSYAVRIVCTR